MTDDLGSRTILALLSVTLYVNHHVLHRKPPSTRKRAPGVGIERWVSILPWTWTASLAFYIAGFEWFRFPAPVPEWLRWVGVVAMIACIPLSQWIYRSLGTHFSKQLEIQKNHRLVQEGPYAYVRHPMYSTLFLCAVATCLISANYIVMATTTAVAGIMLLRMQQEEAMLIKRFGNEYLEYRRRTGALLPKLIH